MNNLSRILNFFLFSLMTAALVGVIIFEQKIVKQSDGHPTSDTQSLLTKQQVSNDTSMLAKKPIQGGATTATTSVVIVTPPSTKIDTRSSAVKNVIPSTAVTPNISVPGPLIVEKNVSTTTVVVSSPSEELAVTQTEIIALTNKERAKEGLPPLSFEIHLTSMADAKAKDMIQKQYFAHVSPDGIDITQLAQTHGYLYLNIGENLALGDFVSSADVVAGWMNSPGHRANILSKNFSQIGVSAIVGNYNGRNVWYAVQEFGRPLSDCTLPDPALKKSVEESQAQIDTLHLSLTSIQSDLSTQNLDQATYNAKVDEYNTLIVLYNQLVAAIKKSIQIYNAQVEAYNICAKG